jgi:hypothetical protein
VAKTATKRLLSSTRKERDSANTNKYLNLPRTTTPAPYSFHLPVDAGRYHSPKWAVRGEAAGQSLFFLFSVEPSYRLGSIAAFAQAHRSVRLWSHLTLSGLALILCFGWLVASSPFPNHSRLPKQASDVYQQQASHILPPQACRSSIVLPSIALCKIT